jgi:hypothetical protein
LGAQALQVRVKKRRSKMRVYILALFQLLKLLKREKDEKTEADDLTEEKT